MRVHNERNQRRMHRAEEGEREGERGMAKLKLCGFLPPSLSLPPSSLAVIRFACTGHAALFIPPTPNNGSLCRVVDTAGAEAERERERGERAGRRQREARERAWSGAASGFRSANENDVVAAAAAAPCLLPVAVAFLRLLPPASDYVNVPGALAL